MSRHRFYLRRLALLGVVLAGITAVTFFIARILPSDPAALYVGPLARAEQIEQARRELGLDRPLYVQYVRYLAGLVRGDWGVSLRTHRPVLQDLLRFLPSSLELVLLAVTVAAAVGVPLGAWAAYRRGSWVDAAARLVSMGGVSVPSFWLALLLQVVFFRALHLLPVSGRVDIVIERSFPVQAVTGFFLLDCVLTGNLAVFKNALPHYLLPVMALAAYPLGVFTRMTRSCMLDVLGQDYIRTAVAHGVPRTQVVLNDALKNAIGPTLTVIGLTFAYCLTGAFFVELIFAWPGLGTYGVKAILSLDYPAIIGVTIVVAAFYGVCNFVVDILQAWLDPRIALR